MLINCYNTGVLIYQLVSKHGNMQKLCEAYEVDGTLLLPRNNINIDPQPNLQLCTLAKTILVHVGIRRKQQKETPYFIMQDIFQPIVVWWKYQNVYSEAPISVFYEFVEISKKSYWSENFVSRI